MPNLVIVAVPEENDYVNRISSQKVAHMTICFLGDVAQVQNLTEIFNFVRHAADTSLSRFGMEVDHRGELGSDNADVLFFSKSKWSGFEEVNLFRSYLLKNDNIRTAYDSTEQHDEWTPHLTLGYPDSPANPDPRDYPGVQYVSFDRIQIWFEEFSGIEIPLKTYRGGEAVAMADIEDVVDDILAHHGVKGMHWGVRRDVHPDIAHIPKKTRKEAAKDAEEHTRAKMFFGEGAGTRRKLINAKVEAKKKKDPLYAQAFDHFVKGTDFAKRSDQARKERRSTDRRTSRRKNTKKAGRILMRELSMLQSSSSPLEEFLEYHGATVEHHGVKGMHWGVHQKITGSSGFKRWSKISMKNVDRHNARKSAKVQKKEAKADAKWEKGLNSTANAIEVHNRSADHFNSKIGDYNKKFEHIDLTKDPVAQAKYDTGAFRLMNEAHSKAFNEVNGTSPSGKFKVHSWVDSEGKEMVASGPTDYVNKVIRENSLKHAVTEPEGFVFQVFRDETQKISKIEPSLNVIAVGDVPMVHILSHHGVKGMHWGVRKSVSAAEQTVRTRTRQARSPEVTVRDRRKKIKTSGGRGLPAHPDAVRVREIGQRGKGSGLKTLSDKELRDYAARLQLEQNVNRLNYNEKPAAQRFVANLLKTEGSRAAKSASGAGASMAGRSALNAATRKSAKFAARVAVVAA